MPFLHPRDLRNLRNQMLRLLEDTPASQDTRLPGEDTWQPRCDVYVTDTHFHVVIDLAGVDRRSVRLTTSEDSLQITGERTFVNNRRNAYYYTLEIETGRFSRHIPFFDEPVDSDHPEVKCENGLLHITFNLRASVERIIEIE